MSQLWELTWKPLKAHAAWVTVSSFWGHLSSSQCTHKMRSQWVCCKLSVSLQLSQSAHCYHCLMSSSGYHTNSSQQAHFMSYKLTESLQQAHSVSHLVSSLWAECPQNEPFVSFNLSSQWVSCELKFFTGTVNNFFFKLSLNWFYRATAYLALKTLNIQPGKTILINAASGAVGQCAGQIAKIKVWGFCWQVYYNYLVLWKKFFNMCFLFIILSKRM